MLLLSALTVGNPFSSRESFGAVLRLRAQGVEAREEIAELPRMELGQFVEQQRRISQLHDELSRLLQSRKYASPTRTLTNHRAILEVTQQLFPKASISVSEESDPEIDDDEYFSVLVQTPGTVDEVVALHREWHDRIRHIAPETAGFYCLLLDIND